MRNLYITFIFSFVSTMIFAQVTSLPLLKGHNGDDTTVHVSSPFTIYERTFVPDDTISIHWSQSENQYLITGDASSVMDSNTMFFRFGTIDTSYLTLMNSNAVISYAPRMVGNFRLAGQVFIANGDGTEYGWDASASTDIIYGNVQVLLDGETYYGRMGDIDDAGVKIRNNEIVEVWVHVKDDVVLKGLPAHDQMNTDILLRHQAGDPYNTYYGHGSWLVLIAQTVQRASFGTGAQPGIVVSYNNVDTVNMQVAGAGVLFNAIPIMDAYDVHFDHGHNRYAITGNVLLGLPFAGVIKSKLKFVPTFNVTAGNDTTAGFLLNPATGSFEVEDAFFQLKGVNNPFAKGGFQLNELGIHVTDNVPDSIICRVTFPSGSSFEGALGFIYDPDKPHDERFHIHSIYVQDEIQNPNEGIPLGTTGFYLVKIAGGISNLNESTDKWVLEADFGFVYGETVTIKIGGSKKVNMFYLETTAILSRKGMQFDASASVGAYYSGGQWSPLLGTATLNMDFIWGHSYSADGLIKVLAPPYDFIDLEIDKIFFDNAGDIAVAGTAELKVPDAIPIIGGKRLAGTSGVMRHTPSLPDQSYSAGWFKINLPFDHIVAGLKVNLADGSASKIGSAAARSISKQTLNDTEEHPSGNENWYVCELDHSFTLDATKPAAYIQNQLVIDRHPFQDPFPPNEEFFSVSTFTHSPSSTIDLLNLLPQDSANTYNNYNQTRIIDNMVNIDMSLYQTSDQYDTIRWITVNNGVNAYQSIDWVHQPDLLLTPGEYTLSVAGYCNEAQDELSESSMDYSAMPVYPRPTISLETHDPYTELTVTYSSYLTDSTRISVYWNSEASHAGGKLVKHLEYYDGTLVADSTYQFVIPSFDPGILQQDTIYVYAVIDDFINSPVYTEVGIVVFREIITGTINGATSATTLIFHPADTLRDEVNIVIDDENNFSLFNVPAGHYSLDLFHSDSTSHIETQVTNFNFPGNTAATYHTPQWLSYNIATQGWYEFSVAVFTFTITPGHIQLYGAVRDTSGNVISGAEIYVLNAQDSILQSVISDAYGYRISSLDTGYVSFAIVLPFENDYHWSANLDQQLPQNIGSLLLQVDSIHVQQASKAYNFIAEPGAQGPFFTAIDDDTGNPVAGVVVTIQLQNGSAPPVQAVTNQEGLAFFDTYGIGEGINYVIRTSWPDGYSAVTSNGQTFQWYGFNDSQVVIGRMD